MNIPHMKAIEYCISELVKSKKVNFHSNGGYKLEMKSIPSHSEIVKSPIPQSPPPPSSQQSKAPQKSKRKTFSFDFTRKLKNSLRRRTMSPTQHNQQTNQRLTTTVTSPIPSNQLQSSNTPTQKVTTPNWSDQQNTSNNNHDKTNLDHSTPQTSTTNYESPLRLQQRNTSSPAHQNPRSRGRDYSDVESVSSSIRGGKVMKRRPSRRRSSKNQTTTRSPGQTTPTKIDANTPLAPRRKSKSNLNETSPFKHSSRSHLDEDNEVDNIFNGSDSLQRRFIRSATDNNHFDFPPPPNDLNKNDGVTPINKPVKDDDSIFGEDSEHVDDIPSGNNGTAQIQRTNSITFNIRQGNNSDSLTFEQINSPPVNRRDLMPPKSSERQRSKTPLSIFEMKDQLQSHINRQRNRPNSCHPSMMQSPPSARNTMSKPIEEDVRYSSMWNKPKQSQLSPKYKSPTLVKTHFTPPHSPTKDKERNILRSKTPAPRPAPRQNVRERPKSVNPDRMLQTGMAPLSPNRNIKSSNPAHALSLEVLEQLSLTRDEWIEYFKTKKTPERLKQEISRLSPLNQTKNQEEESHTEDSGINSPKSTSQKPKSLIC